MAWCWPQPFEKPSRDDGENIARASGAVTPDDIHQHFDIDWLGHRSDRAKRLRALLDVDRARQDRNGHIGHGWIAQLGVPEFMATQPRHHQIEQDQAGNIRGPMFHGTEQVQALEPVFGPDRILEP